MPAPNHNDHLKQLRQTALGSIDGAVQRHSQIWVTALANTPQPLHLRLVVDSVHRMHRTVVTRLLERVQPICPVPRCPAQLAPLDV